MLRRLHHEQPQSFAFTAENRRWAEAQISKYPEGRQASAIIPLLWRAQEQEGWLTRPAIEHVADMLGMAYIRALEVASFYFMFQLQPVGSIAHIQICGTTSCMICGAEDLVAVCREKIADKPHALSADGKFSWEEVECLGACANAPMAQIGKDYYEDLTADKLRDLIDAMAAGKTPQPGPQNGRFAAEPASGLTSLTEFRNAAITLNASAGLAAQIGDTLKRIDGTEVPMRAPWQSGLQHGGAPARAQDAANSDTKPAAMPAAASDSRQPPAAAAAAARRDAEPPAAVPTAETPAADVGTRPASLEVARDGQPDDLKRIKGIGPKLEQICHRLGFFHFDQIAAWTADEIAWVDANLEGFKGRVTRDEWVMQAKKLAIAD